MFNKFHRTRAGEDRNDKSPALGVHFLGRGDDKLMVTATLKGIYSDRLHKGHTVAKYSEDIHSLGLGRGSGLSPYPTEHRLKYKETAIARDINNVKKRRG